MQDAPSRAAQSGGDAAALYVCCDAGRSPGPASGLYEIRRFWETGPTGSLSLPLPSSPVSVPPLLL